MAGQAEKANRSLFTRENVARSERFLDNFDSDRNEMNKWTSENFNKMKRVLSSDKITYNEV